MPSGKPTPRARATPEATGPLANPAPDTCLLYTYDAADDLGVEVSNDQAREEIYGMPYAEWKAKYQKEASPEQQAAFAKSQGNA